MLQKYGPTELNTHYVEFDTICDATQVTFVLSKLDVFNILDAS
jgi:hypothetical protein